MGTRKKSIECRNAESDFNCQSYPEFFVFGILRAHQNKTSTAPSNSWKRQIQYSDREIIVIEDDLDEN